MGVLLRPLGQQGVQGLPVLQTIVTIDEARIVEPFRVFGSPAQGLPFNLLANRDGHPAIVSLALVTAVRGHGVVLIPLAPGRLAVHGVAQHGMPDEAGDRLAGREVDVLSSAGTTSGH